MVERNNSNSQRDQLQGKEQESFLDFFLEFKSTFFLTLAIGFIAVWFLAFFTSTTEHRAPHIHLREKTSKRIINRGFRNDDEIIRKCFSLNEPASIVARLSTECPTEENYDIEYEVGAKIISGDGECVKIVEYRKRDVSKNAFIPLQKRL